MNMINPEELNQQAIDAWRSLLEGERNATQHAVDLTKQDAQLGKRIQSLRESLGGLMATVDTVIEHTAPPPKPQGTKRRKTVSKKTP